MKKTLLHSLVLVLCLGSYQVYANSPYTNCADVLRWFERFAQPLAIKIIFEGDFGPYLNFLQNVNTYMERDGINPSPECERMIIGQARQQQQQQMIDNLMREMR